MSFRNPSLVHDNSSSDDFLSSASQSDDSDRQHEAEQRKLNIKQNPSEWLNNWILKKQITK